MYKKKIWIFLKKKKKKKKRHCIFVPSNAGSLKNILLVEINKI